VDNQCRCQIEMESLPSLGLSPSQPEPSTRAGSCSEQAWAFEPSRALHIPCTSLDTRIALKFLRKFANADNANDGILVRESL
jgi:hypothetical protein